MPTPPPKDDQNDPVLASIEDALRGVLRRHSPKAVAQCIGRLGGLSDSARQAFERAMTPYTEPRSKEGTLGPQPPDKATLWTAYVETRKGLVRKYVTSYEGIKVDRWDLRSYSAAEIRRRWGAASYVLKFYSNEDGRLKPRGTRRLALAEPHEIPVRPAKPSPSVTSSAASPPAFSQGLTGSPVTAPPPYPMAPPWPHGAPAIAHTPPAFNPYAMPTPAAPPAPPSLHERLERLREQSREANEAREQSTAKFLDTLDRIAKGG